MFSARLVFNAIALIALAGCGNMQAVHDVAQQSAKTNMAVVGEQPSPALSAECERNVLKNHVGESVRSSFKRSTPFKTYLPFVTAQGMAHSGQPDLGKKLIPYYAKFQGKDVLGLPSSVTAACFFKVEGGQARFDTSCRAGGSCPYPFYVPWHEYN